MSISPAVAVVNRADPRKDDCQIGLFAGFERRDRVAVDVPDEFSQLVEQANDGVGFCG